MMTPATMNKRAGKALGLAAAIFLAVGLATYAAPSPSPAGASASDPQATSLQPSRSLDAILKDLQKYDYAQGVGVPLELRAYVAAHKSTPAERQELEQKLITFLESVPAPGGIMAACRALRLIGTEASVPVLGTYLMKPETTDMARYALELIPGSEVDKSLLAAFDLTQGAVRRGIVSTLADRKVAAAVPRLLDLAAAKDPEASVDAVMALGKIGSPEAVRGLTGLLGSGAAPRKTAAASALMLIAEDLLKQGNALDAAALYDKIGGAGLPDVLREAAYRGRIAASGPIDDAGFVLKALDGKDAALREAALTMIPSAFEGKEITAVLPYFGKLTEDEQTKLAAVLARFPGEFVRAALVEAAGSPFVPVRVEALRSLEKSGDVSVVPLLAARAVKTTGLEQTVAREALARMRGADVDAAVLDLLEKESDNALKAELITAVGERRIRAGKPVLMKLATSPAPQVQLRAIRALRVVCTAADERVLLELLFTIQNATAREEMEDTAAAVARTIPRDLAKADAAENLYGAEKDAARRASLLRVMGKIGDDTALPIVRKALTDPDKDVADVAVRALADWPDVQARDDVLTIARTATNVTHKVLALRAYVRLIGIEPYRQPQAVVADLEKALALADRPEEKKLVLGALPRFACPEALKLAQSLAADPAVAAEAKAAVERIQRTLSRG